MATAKISSTSQGAVKIQRNSKPQSILRAKTEKAGKFCIACPGADQSQMDEFASMEKPTMNNGVPDPKTMKRKSLRASLTELEMLATLRIPMENGESRNLSSAHVGFPSVVTY